jgi:hypothetical protein
LNATGISSLEVEQQIQNTAITLNTAKAGITVDQVTTIRNTTGSNSGDQDISGIAVNTTEISNETARAIAAEQSNTRDISTIQTDQATQNTAIAVNTTDISNETARAIAAEQSNTTAISTIETDQTIQNTAIALNTTKKGIPTGGTVGQVLTINSSGVQEWIDPSLPEIFYKDTDRDGYGDINNAVIAFSASIDYVSNKTDCNDNDAAINPATVWYIGVDTDSDTFFGSTLSFTRCESPGTGYATTEPTTPDCDDTNAAINPDTVWYLDADGDNYAASTTTQCTSPGAGYATAVLPLDDCNDGDTTINPDTVWYIDADSDGYGASSTVACLRPTKGFLLSELSGTGTDDCDDTNATINPATVWYIDSDSDGYGASSTVACLRPTKGFLLSELSGTGIDDCDDTDILVINILQTWYIDADSDGYGALSEVSCARPTDGFLLSELLGTGIDDCDDTDILVINI